MKSPRDDPALVILAAGASSRLGFCKALAPLGAGPHDTPLSRLLTAAGPRSGPPALLVTGKHDTELRAAAGHEELEILHNPLWRAGRTGSVALAAAARPGLDLFLAPVDVPRVPAQVFGALVDAWRRAGYPARGWLAPRLATPEGQRGGRPRFGHPVIIGRALAAELSACLGADGRQPPSGGKDFPPRSDWRSRPLRAWRATADPLLSLPVTSPEILENLDTPQDLSRMRDR